MVYVEADNILSPLGMTTQQNVEAVMAGRTALRAYSDEHGRLDTYTASLFTAEQNETMAIDGLSPFEAMLVCSVRKALTSVNIDVTSPRTVLIVSSTKGNVESLESDTQDASSLYLGQSARRIASAVGITTTPLTVCNACISGLSAIILAQRLLEAGQYDHAIVCGADRQREFIISGFQSLKALSPSQCRPFDMERTGLNLGEAAATIILGREQTQDAQWAVKCGSVHNDAYHTTQPAKRGDGLLLCLEDVLKAADGERNDEKEKLAVVNAHGTATLFNDQMESVAIERAGLSGVPVNALKGYFGHTMGAAGILETIITMHALDQHVVLGTRGYEECGVSGKVSLSADHLPTDKSAFIKTISGFGGCNAAVLFEKTEKLTAKPHTVIACGESPNGESNAVPIEKICRVHITPQGVELDGIPFKTEGTGLALLTYLYKYTGGDYPKYYKMDALSRLGYVATQLMLKAKHSPTQCKVEGNTAQNDTSILLNGPRTGCIFFNRSSSIASDRKYLASIADSDNYFPSPSVFIYTLPNIVTGEIAIRHGLHGETSFYILPEKSEALQRQILQATFAATDVCTVITGWLDYESESNFEADLWLEQSAKANKSDN